MIKDIIVKKTQNPDEGYTDKEQLYKDTLQHKEDVRKVLYELSYKLKDIADEHDWTKINYFDDFSKDCLERLNTPDFKKRDWYHIHTELERHHINAKVPNKVNLLDLLEMQVDCIISGETRYGYVDKKFLELSNSVLQEAYWNTIDLILEHIIVEEEYE